MLRTEYWYVVCGSIVRNDEEFSSVLIAKREIYQSHAIEWQQYHIHKILCIPWSGEEKKTDFFPLSHSFRLQEWIFGRETWNTKFKRLNLGTHIPMPLPLIVCLTQNRSFFKCPFKLQHDTRTEKSIHNYTDFVRASCYRRTRECIVLSILLLVGFYYDFFFSIFQV